MTPPRLDCAGERAIPTISLLIMLMKSVPFVRTVLEEMRDVVDEVVVTAGDNDSLDAVADVADVRLLTPSAPQNRQMGVLLNRCRGDWLLFIDDDEVPSPAFLRALPDLVEDRFVTHHTLPRRWLYPDETSYIATKPWVPDHQVRLVRNIPALWRFPGVTHEPLLAIGPVGLADAGIYHCNALLLGAEERRQRADAYEATRPGWTNDGFPVNAMHTPDDVPGLPLRPVPAEDLELIRRCLAARPVAGSNGPARAPVVACDVVGEDRYSETRTFAAGAHAGSLTFVDPPATLRAGQVTNHEVEIENAGTERWDEGGRIPPGMFASYHWLTLGAEVAEWEGLRSALLASIGPGQRRRSMLAVRAPDEPGEYVLQPSLVHERVAWFGDTSGVPVRVLPPDAEVSIVSRDGNTWDVWTPELGRR